MLVSLAWPVAWLLLWRVFLFDALVPSASTGQTIYNDNQQTKEVLWIVFAFSVALIAFASLLLPYSSQVRRNSSGWGTGVRVTAVVLGLVAVSLPLMFPRVDAVVLDESAETISLESRWLYTSEAKTIAFDVIERIQWREEGILERGECYPVTTLKVLANDFSQIALPRDLRLESIALEFSEATQLPIELIGGQTC
jgi:hypothetical protein